MPAADKDAYFYIEPRFIINQGCGGKEFLKEQIDTFISTIQCMKRLISACVDNYEMENLVHCLSKFRSSIADLNVNSLTVIIEKLLLGAKNTERHEILSEKLNEFLLICELVELDLAALKQNEDIQD